MSETIPDYFSDYCQEIDWNGDIKTEVLDGNLWCKECNEIITFCTDCIMREDEDDDTNEERSIRGWS
jgi:hypothetical protein